MPHLPWGLESSSPQNSLKAKVLPVHTLHLEAHHSVSPWSLLHPPLVHAHAVYPTLWCISSSTAEHVRGRAGGGWDQEEEEEAVLQRPTQEITPTALSTSTLDVGMAETDHTPSADGDLESEIRLVETITQVGGVRVAPPRDQLQQFIER